MKDIKAVRSVVWAGLLVVCAAGMGRAQGLPSPTSSGLPSRPTHQDPTMDTRVPAVPPAIQEKMAIARNDERQKRLVADTDQLLALATKLKEEVDKTDKYTLSLDVVKRTTEIERLAKSIRDRMKD